MDARLYILAGLFVFLLAALGYLVIAVAMNARGRDRRAPAPPRDPPVAPTLHETLATPLRVGDWRPDSAEKAFGIPAEPACKSEPGHDRSHVEPRAESIELVSSVELWFGDSRVGVKAGTKTYDQFRRYADALFADLAAARERERRDEG